jgi:hypothetical protein
VEAHAQATGQRVVGYYHANALARDTELPTAARRVADALAAAHPGCIVLLVRKTQQRVCGGSTHPGFVARLTHCNCLSPQADAQALAERETALPPVAWQVSAANAATHSAGGEGTQA